MRDLFLIGVHESGEYVVLGSQDDDVEFRLPLDEAFREAARWERGFDPGDKKVPALRPAEVQALIRAGASTTEAAERAGWSVEKVHRFDGPVLAERAHIAELAGHAHVRGHSFGQGVELRRLVEERLAERDIDPALIRWDSRRGEDGQWIVEVRFPAEHQAHIAKWRFSRSTMTVAALDNHARSITEDQPAQQSVGSSSGGATEGTVTSLRPVGSSGTTTGRAKVSSRSAPAHRDHPDAEGDTADDDLVADLRERSAARIRRRGARRATSGTARAAAGPTILSEASAAGTPSSTSAQADDRGDDSADAPTQVVHADEELPFDSGPGSIDEPDKEPPDTESPTEGGGSESAVDAGSPGDPAVTDSTPEDEAIVNPLGLPDDSDDESTASASEEPPAQAGPSARDETSAQGQTQSEREVDSAESTGSTEAEDAGPATLATSERTAEPRAEAAQERATEPRAEAAPQDEAEREAGTTGAPAAPAKKAPARKRAPRAGTSGTKRATTARRGTKSGSAAGEPEATPSPTTEAQSGDASEAFTTSAPPAPTSAKAGTTRRPSGSGSAFTKASGDQQSATPASSQPRQTRPKSGSRGRASVPAWDDIMFGARPGSD